MPDPTFGKRGLALRMMELRWRKLRITQRTFSARFGIPFGTVKDAEQGRVHSTAALRVLIEAIALDPALIERAARIANGGIDIGELCQAIKGSEAA